MGPQGWIKGWAVEGFVRGETIQGIATRLGRTPRHIYRLLRATPSLWPEMQRRRLAKQIPYYKKYPWKNAAKARANLAQKRGIIRRPERCTVCPSPATDKHHPDHKEALKVVWLCHPCHMHLEGMLRRRKAMPHTEDDST